MGAYNLNVQPVQTPDVLGEYGKVVQLRSLLQNQQYQQQMQPLQLQEEQQNVAINAQKVKDIQAGTAAWGEWDGKDYNQLGSLIVKHGGSMSEANNARMFGLQAQEKYSTILKNGADAGRAQVETAQKNNDIAAGKIGALSDVPDADLPQRILQTAQEGVQNGWLDPQHAQMAQQLAQQPIAQIRQGLPLIAKSYMSESEQAKSALDAADLAAKKAQLPGQQAESQMKTAEAAAMQQTGGMNQQMADSKYRFLQSQIAAGKPVAPDDQAFIAGYEKQKKLVPLASAQIRIDGMAQARENQAFDHKLNQPVFVSSAEINRAAREEPGRYTLAGFTPEAIQAQGAARDSVTPQVANELVAFSTAAQHADLLGQAAIAMKNGDVKVLNSLRNRIKTELGSPDVTNFGVIANAYNREVTKALTGGHITDNEIKEQGLTIPSNAGPDQIQGAVEKYKALMTSKIQQRQNQYNSARQGAMPFGDNAQPSGGGTQGAGGGLVTMKAPNGQTKPVNPSEVEHYKSMGATVVSQ
jgi:hypothetical protein